MTCLGIACPLTGSLISADSLILHSLQSRVVTCMLSTDMAGQAGRIRLGAWLACLSNVIVISRLVKLKRQMMIPQR